jgi:DNA-binding XRE family transcriptional regulator
VAPVGPPRLGVVLNNFLIVAKQTSNVNAQEKNPPSMVNAEPSVSPGQVRAARAWLGWNQEELAKKAGLSKNALNRFEQGKHGILASSDKTSQLLRKSLEEAGIRFHFKNDVGVGIEITRSIPAMPNRTMERLVSRREDVE